MVKVFGLGSLVVAMLAAGCTGQDTLATTALPRPDTAPGRLLSFSGTLQPQGIKSYSFGVTTAGEVEVTLLGAALVGVEPAQSVTLGLGIGTASAYGSCLLTHSVNAQGGPRAQLTGTGQEGTLCVSIFDVGTLTGPANFSLTVATP